MAYSISCSLQRLKQWDEFLTAIRSFFKADGFMEVNTPTLVVSPGLEPFIEPFKTKLTIGRFEQITYLPTSPEFHLKKLLAAGCEKIFEICPCFRNGEVGPAHQPEFMMLEWYRAHSNIQDIRKDVLKLLENLNSNLDSKEGGILPYLGTPEIKTMSQLFENIEFQLTPTTSRNQMADLATRLGINFESEDSFDDIFFRVFLEKIEPYLGLDNPLIVANFPPSQSALANINDEGWTDRFEVFWRGVEIANAYDELTDPNEYRRRFQSWQKQRLKNSTNLEGDDSRTLPIDEDLLKALESGIPHSGGIALGLDRLFMAFYGEKDIANIRPFILRYPY